MAQLTCLFSFGIPMPLSIALHDSYRQDGAVTLRNRWPQPYQGVFATQGCSAATYGGLEKQVQGQLLQPREKA